MTLSQSRPTRLPIFNPWVVLLCSLAGTIIWAIYLLRSPAARASMVDPTGMFFYMVPIAVPVIAFMFERVERVREANFFQHGIDFLVFALTIGRVVGDVPLISGHSLSLTYALLTSRSLVVRISAAIVLVQTLIMKYVVWHDFVTSSLGLVLGGIAAYLVSRFGQLEVRTATPVTSGRP